MNATSIQRSAAPKTAGRAAAPAKKGTGTFAVPYPKGTEERASEGAVHTGSGGETKETPKDIFTSEWERYIFYAQQYNKGRKNERTEEEEDRLFASDKGVFSNESINALKKLFPIAEAIDWEADGMETLSETEIAYLKSKYDVENMNADQFMALLTELTQMNALSGKEALHRFIRPGAPGAEHGIIIGLGEEAFMTGLNDTAGPNYLQRLLGETQMLNDLLESIRSGNHSLNEDLADSVRRYYEDRLAESQKLADILSLLKREDTESTSEEKARTKTAPLGLSLVGPAATDAVKEAWQKAAQTAGYNGAGMEPDGRLSSISQLFAMSLIDRHNGGTGDVLGSTDQSAITAVKRALEMLEIPKNEKQQKEKNFYEAFLMYFEQESSLMEK